MLVLSKGECEHCHKSYRFDLLSATFGECSYAYCDSCGMLATLSYHDPRMALLPPTDILHQEIDEAWESWLAPCACGGSFRRGASPRCPNCHLPLSAEIAGEFIETNKALAKGNWRWQRNWSDEYCMAIADPTKFDQLLQIANPFPKNQPQKSKKRFLSFFSKK